MTPEQVQALEPAMQKIWVDMEGDLLETNSELSSQAAYVRLFSAVDDHIHSARTRPMSQFAP